MTKNEALEVARGICVCSCHNRTLEMIAGNFHYAKCLTDLIDEVAQALLDAVQSEREACAKILDNWDTSESWENPDDYTDEIAQAIRQRSEPNA